MHVVQLRRLAFEVTAEAEEPKGRSQNVAECRRFFTLLFGVVSGCLGTWEMTWGDLSVFVCIRGAQFSGVQRHARHARAFFVGVCFDKGRGVSGVAFAYQGHSSLNISQIEVVWRIGKLKPLLEARSHCHPSYALTVTLIGFKSSTTCKVSILCVATLVCFSRHWSLKGQQMDAGQRRTARNPVWTFELRNLTFCKERRFLRFPKYSQKQLCQARRLSSLMPTATRSGAPAMRQFISVQKSWEWQTYDEHMMNMWQTDTNCTLINVACHALCASGWRTIASELARIHCCAACLIPSHRTTKPNRTSRSDALKNRKDV